MSVKNVKNEIDVSAAFSKQSSIFDDTNNNEIISWMRTRAREEVLANIQPNSRILELNCGTGIDSLYFAQKGFDVVATDNADGMLVELNRKISSSGVSNKISSKKVSFNKLEKLNEGQFDYVFSNFGGLNCTDKLNEVLEGIDKVLKPGGHFTLVIMPTVCPWELLMFFRGYFKTAFRRFKKSGTKAHLEGVHFTCYYYNPSYVIKHAGENFQLKSVKGLCITVPPPFIEHFHENHPGLFRFLEKIETKLWSLSPFNRWSDHYVITMQKLK